MSDLFFARSQMGMSLAFHIIFAVIGMAMPLLMAVSEGCYLWTKRPIYLELSKRWAAGTPRSFAFSYGSWGELHCCAFAELIECLRWLFIMFFADRTQVLQTERLELGFRDTFLFDRPAKSEAS
jgi:hypothetical protein